MKSNPFISKPPTEILALYQRYRAGESVRALLSELGLEEMTDSQFHRIFTNVRINDLNCSICSDAPMLAKLPSKTKPLTQILYTCQNCDHTIISDIEGNVSIPVRDCNCKQCTGENNKQQKLQSMSFIDKIRKAYEVQQSLPYQTIDEVRLAELVGLHALVNTWAAEDLTHLLPLEEKLELFWPTRERSVSSLSEIYQNSLLNVDLEHCTAAAFVENPDGKIAWYILRAALIPSIRSSSEFCMSIPDTQNFLGSLLPDGLSNHQKSELPLLMRAIAVDECIQYIQFMLNEYGFDSDTGEKTEKLFEELLDKMPVNQILVCIWTAVKGAAAFMQSPGCKGRKHAFNSIYGKLRDAAQRRITGEFDSKGFDRNKYCLRSEISFSLYGLLGFDGDIGFDTRLMDIMIPKEWEPVAEEDDDSDFEYMSFTDEEQTVLESHGFEVFSHFDATRRLLYSDQLIQVFKIQAELPYFEMSVKVGRDSEYVEARLATLDAVIFYLGAFEKSNQLAEMLGE